MRAACDEFAHRVLLAGGDHEILRLLLLQHQPLRFDVLARVAPVPPRLEVPEIKAVLLTQADPRERARDLPADEGLAPDRGFVIEQNAVAGEKAVGFAVVDGDPVGIELGDPVGRARIERSSLGLGRFARKPEELRGGSLVEPRFVLESQDPDRLEKPQRPECVRVRGVFRLLERHHHVALRGEIVDLVRLHLLGDVDETARVGHVAVMQDEAAIRDVRVLIEMVDPLGVEQGSAPLDAVHLVTLVQEKFRQVGPVLAGDSGDQSDFLFFHETGYCSLRRAAVWIASIGMI